MPLSRLRRRSPYTPPAERAPVRVGNPRWLVPLMLAFFLMGLLWIVVFYVSGAQYPVASLGNLGNLGVGFGFIIVGFALSTRWR